MGRRVVVRSPIVDRLGRRFESRFDPVLDRRRLEARLGLTGAGGYSGARTDRAGLKDWDPRLDSADEALVPALQRLRARSGDLARNNPVARAGLGSVVRNAVADGLIPLPRPDWHHLGLTKEEAATWAESAWRIWWAVSSSVNLDIRRTSRFASLQALVLRSRLERGDVFVVRRFRERPGDLLGLKVQLVEADRVSTPPSKIADERIVEGVEMDGDGAPVAYWVQDQHPGEFSRGKRTWTRVPAFSERTGSRMVLHLHDIERVGQTRGVPFLAPIIELLKQLGRYTDSEVMAAVVNGMVVYSLETPLGEDFPRFVDQQAPEVGEHGADPEDSRRDLEVDYGAVLGLAEGEKLNMHAPTRPNSGFGDFVVSVYREAGAALGVPHEVMLQHFSRSYSASRAAWLLAWKTFWAVRDQVAWDFCHPVYGWAIEEAVARGYLSAPGFDDPLIRAAYLDAEWRGAPPGQLDPLKEMQAIEKRRTLRISTLEQDTAEVTGGDWRANLQQLAIEEREVEALGLHDWPTGGESASATSPSDPDPEEDE